MYDAILALTENISKRLEEKKLMHMCIKRSAKGYRHSHKKLLGTMKAVGVRSKSLILFHRY